MVNDEGLDGAIREEVSAYVNKNEAINSTAFVGRSHNFVTLSKRDPSELTYLRPDQMFGDARKLLAIKQSSMI